MRVAWAERRTWLLVVAAVLAVGLLLVFGRSWLSERLVPDPRMTRRIEQAEVALHAGKLSAADGSGARELFESVLALDPDQMRARQGLLEVREAAIARAQRALAAHRLAEAADALTLAQALSAPQVQLQPLQARLQDLRKSTGNLPALLARASAPGIDHAEALEIYRQVLALDADNASAIAARDELLATQLQQADKLLSAGNLPAAQAVVDAVVAQDPAHLDLPPVQARLGEAIAVRQAQQSRELAAAARDEKAGRLDRAAQRYLRIAAEDPDRSEASEGLQRLATRLALQAQRLAEDFQFHRAQASLEKARHWSPAAAQIAIAERSVQQSRQASQRLGAKPGRKEREQLPLVLAEAQAAIAREDFITPPGASAWDRLRVASAIAPGAPEVRKLERALGQASRHCFEQALDQGRLNRAQACLEASVQVDAASVTASARQQLAERWLAYAEERIGASDWTEAEKAIRRARQWQPVHPGLRAIELRLRTARRGAPAR